MNPGKFTRTILGTPRALYRRPSWSTLSERLKYMKAFAGFSTVFTGQDGLRFVVNGKGHDWYALDTHEEYLAPHMTFTPGGTFVDVGAHVGGYSCRAARAGSVVHAFEPDPENFRRLQENARINGLDFSMYRVALGEKEGELPMISRGALSAPLSAAPKDGDPKGVNNVPLRRLDSFEFAPSLIKIDTEGYEPEVLSGGMNTIRRWSPKIVYETHSEAGIIRCEGFFKTIGYSSKCVWKGKEFHRQYVAEADSPGSDVRRHS